MINGLEVKLPQTLADGTLDCETAYIASFVKCPEMAKRARSVHLQRVEMAALTKKLAILGNQLEQADNVESVDKAKDMIFEVLESVSKLDSDMLTNANAMFKAGFLSAGYDEANATRLSEAIPLDRIDEILGVCKIGAGVMDFFTPPHQHGGN